MKTKTKAKNHTEPTVKYLEYEELFAQGTYKGQDKVLVEFDPYSNRPFMVYELNKDDLQYSCYSGEDTLERAIDVAKERCELI